MMPKMVMGKESCLCCASLTKCSSLDKEGEDDDKDGDGEGKLFVAVPGCGTTGREGGGGETGSLAGVGAEREMSESKAKLEPGVGTETSFNTHACLSVCCCGCCCFGSCCCGWYGGGIPG